MEIKNSKKKMVGELLISYAEINGVPELAVIPGNGKRIAIIAYREEAIALFDSPEKAMERYQEVASWG